MRTRVARRVAEHKAAALYSLSWEQSTSALIWARVVEDNVELHESARSRFAADTADQANWERLHGTALVLVVAIDQILGFQRRVLSLTGDASLVSARERFDAIAPDVEALRDLVAHYGEYVVGEGWRQIGKKEPPMSKKSLDTFIYWGDGEGPMLNLGDERVNIREAAGAAIELAKVVESVRAKHALMAAKEADAALRRRLVWSLNSSHADSAR